MQIFCAGDCTTGQVAADLDPRAKLALQGVSDACGG